MISRFPSFLIVCFKDLFLVRFGLMSSVYIHLLALVFPSLMLHCMVGDEMAAEEILEERERAIQKFHSVHSNFCHVPCVILGRYRL
jgi:hypothetical protein